MTWELDHVLFADSDPARVEESLVGFGLEFTLRRVHEGQGTANVCAVFDNAFFEVLFPHDTAQLQSDRVALLGLQERILWRETGACPFGVCFRSPGTTESGGDLPFATWEYAAPYLPEGMGLPIVTPGGRIEEPLVFLLGRTRAAGWAESRAHAGRHRVLTAVQIQRPADASGLSEGVRWFVEQGLLSVTEGPEYLLTMQWDGGREGGFHRLPDLPLAFCW